MGSVFLSVGALTCFPSISLIEELATRFKQVLTLGILSGHSAMHSVAELEGLIELSFLTGWF